RRLRQLAARNYRQHGAGLEATRHRGHGRLDNKGHRRRLMSIFERYLTLWVAICIVAGIAAGHFVPGLFQVLAALEYARVNLPMAVLIWLMIIPMLVRIDFMSLRQIGSYWRGIGITLFINWAVKPFSMALLGWL